MDVSGYHVSAALGIQQCPAEYFSVALLSTTTTIACNVWKLGDQTVYDMKVVQSKMLHISRRKIGAGILAQRVLVIKPYSRKVLISSASQLAAYLIIGPRRIALIGAIAAVALAIIFYPLIVFTPFDPEKVTIELANVKLLSGSEGEQKLDLAVAFNITNNNEFTLTTSRIDYDLFANDALVGSDTISYEDVPVNGRPVFFSNQPVNITDTMTMQYSDENAALFRKILDNSTDINWRVNGSASVESGTTQQEKTFSAEL